MNLDLGLIASTTRSFLGVARKMRIVEITERLRENVLSIVVPDAKVIESFGEDCAVIDIGDMDRFLLFKVEEMWHELLNSDPRFAGYCSVLANVNDVSVKGGTPIAVVNTMAAASPDTRSKIVEGIADGCMKFNVPMVGGHLNPDAPFNALTVAIVGLVKKTSLIRSSTARSGDLILVAIDLDGHFHNLFKYAWDTTSPKPKAEVADRLNAIREIAAARLPTAGKDISNPGILGTLGMLLHAGNVGGDIDLTRIPMPRDVDLDRWLKAYPGFGVVLTVSPRNSDECISIFHKHKVEAKVVGKVDYSGKLVIKDGQSSAEIFDFRKDRISGRP